MSPSLDSWVAAEMMLSTSQSRSVKPRSSTGSSQNACPGDASHPLRSLDSSQPCYRGYGQGLLWITPAERSASTQQQLQPGNEPPWTPRPTETVAYSRRRPLPLTTLETPNKSSSVSLFQSSNPLYWEEIIWLLFYVTNFRVICFVAIIIRKWSFLALNVDCQRIIF